MIKLPKPPELVKKLFLKYWFCPLIFLFILLRLPSLSEPHVYGDEGIYLTLGQAFRRGAVFYKDIHDNKPPLLYLLAAAANNFSTYRLILFVWSGATIFAFWQLAKKLFHRQEKAIIACFAFVLLTTLRTFEGNIANAENFFMLPIIVGFWLLLTGKEKTPLHHAGWRWFSTGLLISVATLFKVPAVFDLFGLVVLNLFWFNPKKLSSHLKQISLAVIGFAIPLGSSLIYYFFKGALKEYFVAALGQNIPYLASWSGSAPQASGLPLALLSRGLLMLLAIGLLFWFRRKLPANLLITSVWLVTALFAALLSGRPYPHYLLQLMPAFALWWGLVIQKKWWRWLPIAGSLFILLIMIGFRFYHYENLPYYQNFYSFALGAKDKEAYFRYFGDHTPSIYETAAFLKNYTQPEEKIFIWGNDPFVYALADRSPIGRYSVSYHIIDFDGYQETLESLTASPPRYLVVSNSESRPFPELFQFIHTHYFRTETIGGFQIFRQSNLGEP